VGVLVIVDELELEFTPVGHDEDRGVPDHLVEWDSDLGDQTAVGSLLGVGETASVNR
jgi:hypothetical protein